MKGSLANILFSACLVLLTVFSTKAQYVTVPDPNFASYLSTRFPGVIVNGNQLDTNLAKTFSGKLEATNREIFDATGIEYFKNIDEIILTENKLTSFPLLTGFIKLKSIILSQNKIESLPSVRHISTLTIYRVAHNNLTELEDMSGMTQLVSFFCNSNRLTKVPDLTGNINLEHIIVSDNFITALPDLSSLVSLRRFLCSNNLLTEADLTSIPNVKEIHLRSNKLTKFPNISGMTQITELLVNSNLIESIPDLSSFTNLTYLDVFNNLLTFEDLIPLKAHPNFSNFGIAPQKKVGNPSNIVLQEKRTFTYDLKVDNSVGNNIYSWYRNGQFIKNTSVNTLIIDNINVNDKGYYTCIISNQTPGLDTIKLHTNARILEVASCMDISELVITIPKIKCSGPTEVNIDESTILAGEGPFTYKITNVISGKAEEYSASSVSLTTGNYHLTIIDSHGCEKTAYEKIKLPRGQNCDPVIYPEMPGPESSYFIEATGKAVVYNVNGEKVFEAESPTYFKGKDKSGNILDSGLYMIVVNDQINIPVTIIRTR
ncbi:MAG: hypothetical protein ACK40G_12220 [Cytophagaceae bacterium]